jgi:acyl-CoA thioester hydrolase
VGVFVAEVRPRWSDMDAFGHVNHANTVTLLEEARIDLLFVEASRHGAAGMADGMVVARLVVDYHQPLLANGTKVRVEMSVRDLRRVSFTLGYTVHSGLSHDDPVVATAETMLVPFDIQLGRPRRLSETERDFLAAWKDSSAGSGISGA